MPRRVREADWEVRLFPSEAALQKFVVERLRSAGILVFPVTDRYNAGVPDLLICLHGWFVGVELKNGMTVVSKLQGYIVEQIIANKGVAAVCRNWGEVKWLINKTQDIMLDNGVIKAADVIKL